MNFKTSVRIWRNLKKVEKSCDCFYLEFVGEEGNKDIIIQINVSKN